MILSWRRKPTSLNSASSFGLIPQYADILSATIFRNSENETHSYRMIQPSNSLVSMDPNESNAYIYTEACTQTLRAALSITCRTWKQPRCPLAGEWTHRLDSIRATECSSALKRNERYGVAGRREGHLKCISLTERRQSGKVA